MRTVFSAVCLTVIMTAIPTLSFGWDDVGHKTTAYIAWQRMSPAAREAVIKILRTAPEDSDVSAFWLPGAEPEQIRKMHYFMMLASWADSGRDRTFDVR